MISLAQAQLVFWMWVPIVLLPLGFLVLIVEDESAEGAGEE